MQSVHEPLFAFLEEELMTQIHPTIRRMSFEEQVEYGLCSRGLMMEHGEEVYRLSAGTTDSLYVFKSGTVIFVLTINHQLDYLGLDWYQAREQEPIDSVFLQGDAIREIVSKDWHALPLSSLATRLIQLFQ